ncbi:unnamed protein product, partial [Prorocentrum cordatum]
MQQAWQAQASQAAQGWQQAQQWQVQPGPSGSWPQQQQQQPPARREHQQREPKKRAQRKRQKFAGVGSEQELAQALFEERSEQLLSRTLEPLREAIIDVPRSCIAKVIGKGGQQICIIRRGSGAQVDARQQHSDPCPVRVFGSAQAIEKARDMIWDLVELANLRSGTVLYITRAKIGKVIGIRGAQIKEIQATTGAKVDVDKDVDPCKVIIGGDPDKVEHAKRLVLTLAMETADGESEYLDLPKNATGAVLGIGGQRLRELQLSSGARIDVDKTQPSVCRVRIAGTPEQIETAKQLVMLAVETPRPVEALVAPHLEASRRRPRRDDPNAPPTAICTVPIPAGASAARLIGRGGAMIQALQGQTGTRIWVDVEASEVRISGPQEGVEVARDLVQELLSGNTPAALMPQ